MNKKLIAAIIAGLISLLGIVLIWQRGGIFAWIFSITGALLLIEITRIRSRTTMLKNTMVTACTLTALWLLTHGSIIGIWETGEVAELKIDTGSEEHQVRVWLLDVNDNIEIFYDAEPDVAEVLLNEPKVTVRNDQTLEFLKVEISTLETAPAEKMNQIFELWNEKYGSRNLATPIYSLMFGRAKDKVALILTLTR